MVPYLELHLNYTTCKNLNDTTLGNYELWFIVINIKPTIFGICTVISLCYLFFMYTFDDLGGYGFI